MRSMSDSIKSPLHIFVHMPKTGGTTINGHLSLNMDWDEEFIHLGPWGKKYRQREGRSDPFNRSTEDRAAVRVLAGHHVRWGVEEQFGVARDARYITIFREPAARFVSHYNFVHSHSKFAGQPVPSFWEWYEKKKRNPMTKFMKQRLDAKGGGLKRLLRRLDKFWFVGVTEHLNEDLPHLFREIEVPEEWKNLRVAGESERDTVRSMIGHHPDRRKIVVFQQLTPEISERVAAENPRDMKLFDYAKQRRLDPPWAT